LSSKNQKSHLVIIFVTVFIYLLGFGIIIPVMPILSRDFGASSTQVGMLMAIFSLMQFLFSPFWGRLSDKFGRRPILLICLLGEGLAYLLFASARSLEGLFVARALAGFFGASLATASAYISDVTPEDSRSKGMALIGAAFGLGFVFGPALGGLLAFWGHQINPAPYFDTSFSSLWVAGICFVNFFFALKYLKESLVIAKGNKSGQGSDLGQRPSHQQHRSGRLNLLISKMKMQTVGPLMLIYFLLSFAMAAMESCLILFMADYYKWGVQQTSLGFAFIGVMMVLTQGFLVRKVIPLFGERRILFAGVFIFAFGMSGLVWSPDLTTLAITISLLSIGIGLSNPSILGSVSLLTPADQQGVTMGVTQSLSSLGRIVGPVVGGALYKLQPTTPFVTATALALVAGAIVLSIFNRIPMAGQKTKA
jgi:DHA1 family tetracycline resistance protein-like MFS transporter